METVVTKLQEDDNRIFIKRDDLFPFSFGGNKARKAVCFFNEIDKGGYDSVVTYGSSSSNHCRAVSNMAAQRKLPCYIISPEESSEATYNSKMMELFGAEITVVPVERVHDTIENKLNVLKASGKKPYFIQGGGHGNLGTGAYVECYEEIINYEKQNGLKFDYIFLASGTGATQAGLVCGQLVNGDDRKIVGISIARKNPRGRDVVLQSIKDYLNEKSKKLPEDVISSATVFIDDYIGDGYGRSNDRIVEIIKQSFINYGIPMDSTYTAKAFYGMQEYIKKEKITGKNILFIHTGGTPLFFDDLRGL